MDGRPKAGAHVHARMKGDSPFSWKESVADQEGAYRIKGLPPGEYFAKINEATDDPALLMSIATLGQDDEVAGAAKVVVEAGKETRLDLYETPKCVVEGRVMEAGQPAPGMKVRLFRKEAMMFMPLKTAWTDENGAFLMEAIDAGSYSVDVELRSVPDSPSEDVTLVAGEQRRIDFELPAGRITGRVTDGDTDKPVAGIQINLERYQEEDTEEEAEGQTMIISVNAVTTSGGGGESIQAFSISGGAEPIVTDAEGYYAIPHVMAGEYTVVASGNGYARKDKGPVQVEEGETTANQDLAVERGYRVSGILKDGNTGASISFMPVFLDARDDKTKEWVQTESMAFAQDDGSFEFADLKSGNYKLRALDDHYKGEMEIFLTHKDLADLEFNLIPR
jgi:5-hydroxyisourate hydrolase-like protein (transthyretin family)